MRRVVIPEPNKAILEDYAEPKPSFGEVCLKIAYCGICGSDLHAFKGEHPFISLPATPGHEFSGTISELGEGVSGYNIGDRVTVEPSLVCGQCYNCKTGRYNICNELRVMGCQSEGAMADYLVVPAEKVIPIPNNLSLKSAVLAEPLAVGIHSVKKGGVLLNKNVVIIGAGMIGLATLSSVVKARVQNIFITDLSDERLKIAKKIGATRIINASKVDPVDIIINEQPYEGIDVIFECVGIEKTIRDAISLARKGGRIVVVGVFCQETKIKMAYIQDRELELIGSLMYIRRDFKEAIKILENDSSLIDQLISKIFPLDQPQDAFNAALDTKNNLKVIFEINKE